MWALASTTNSTLPAAYGTAAAVLLVVALSTLGLLALWIGWKTVKSTTLTSAWWWTAMAVAGVAALALASALGFDAQSDTLAAARFAIGALALCPAVSVLGAKRPQDKPWNFVVLSLWVIVALPAFEMFVLQRGQELEVSTLRGWFLWILLALTPISYGPTRYGLASVLIALGQVLLLAEHLPMLREHRGHHDIVALLATASGLTLAASLSVRTRFQRGYARVWADFRDTFGLFWAARVAERLNAAAQQLEWDHVLRWNGFHNRSEPSGAPEQVELPDKVRLALDGLLRRFVSKDWIARRAEEDVD